MTLDDLAPRNRAQITSVDWASLPEADAKRLRALGVDEGARIAIAHRGVFGGRDPLALMIGRMVVAVRRSHARAISVEHV